MKQTSIKTLYRLFAYLSDRTNGFKPFVHYKLMLGALLISLTANACKGKPTPTVPVADPEPETEESTCYAEAVPATNEPEEISEVLCYKAETQPINVISNTSDEMAEPLDMPVIIDRPIMCYMPAVVSPLYQDEDIIGGSSPLFPGVNEVLTKFLKDNIRYMEGDTIGGTIEVRYYVSRNGKVRKVKVIRSDRPELNKEITRVVKSIPRGMPDNRSVYDTLFINIPKIEQ